MALQISEPDWKNFRRLQPIALERFCQTLLSEVVRRAADPAKSSHARYLEVFALIRERDEEMAAAFDGPRRSTALMQLAQLRSLGVVADDEFAGFSAETRAAVALLLGTSDAEPGVAGDRRKDGGP